MPAKTTKAQAATAPVLQDKQYIRVITLDPRRAVGNRQISHIEFLDEVFDNVEKFNGTPCRIQFELRSFRAEDGTWLDNWVLEQIKKNLNEKWTVSAKLVRRDDGKYSHHLFQVISTVTPAVASFDTYVRNR